MAKQIAYAELTKEALIKELEKRDKIRANKGFKYSLGDEVFYVHNDHYASEGHSVYIAAKCTVIGQKKQHSAPYYEVRIPRPNGWTSTNSFAEDGLFEDEASAQAQAEKMTEESRQRTKADNIRRVAENAFIKKDFKLDGLDEETKSGYIQYLENKIAQWDQTCATHLKSLEDCVTNLDKHFEALRDITYAYGDGGINLISSMRSHIHTIEVEQDRINSAIQNTMLRAWVTIPNSILAMKYRVNKYLLGLMYKTEE